jgi:hypothetical protein
MALRASLVAASSWPASRAVWRDSGFPLWFQGHLCSCWPRSSHPGGDPSRSFCLFSWFWSPYSPPWSGLSCAGEWGCQCQSRCRVEMLYPSYACRACASVILGSLSDGERFGSFRPCAHALQATPGSRVTALRCLVNPLLQPGDVACELAPGEGTPRVAHPVWGLVIHALPHWLLAAFPLQYPSSRQRILWLSQRRWLLEASHPVPQAVDPCSRSPERAVTGVLRSLSPCSLSGGSYHTPGVVRGVPRA